MKILMTTSAQSWQWLKRCCATIILLVLILILTGCGGKECSHEWQDATCTTPSTCRKCEITRGEPNGHTYSGQTCVGVDKCIVCGAIIPTSGHAWVDATCTSPKTCSKCGETEGDPLGHSFENGVCTVCGEFGEQAWTTLSQTGDGNQTIEGITIGFDYYKLHAIHNGDGQFEIKMIDSTGASAILVHTSGSYEGTVLMYGAGPVTFNISASGGWSYEINRVEAGEGTLFTGTGDGVSQKTCIPSGSYHITHSGKGNFYVYAFYPGGVTEVIKPGAVKGAYDKQVDLQFPEGAEVIFEVHADGQWTIRAG